MKFAVARLKSDEAGHFLAAPADGTYVAFFEMPGFPTQTRAFEMAQDAKPPRAENFDADFSLLNKKDTSERKSQTK